MRNCKIFNCNCASEPHPDIPQWCFCCKLLAMSLQQQPSNDPATATNKFGASDVVQILRERGWLAGAEASQPQQAWFERAAAMLGSHAGDRESFGNLLELIFHYDAREILGRVESHAALARHGAREVVRKLAFLLLDGPSLDSERFKEIITTMKEGSDLRSRDLFHPIRLALTGRTGEGDLDRVVLLLDEAATLPFQAPVKTARARIVEFCAALE